MELLCAFQDQSRNSVILVLDPRFRCTLLLQSSFVVVSLSSQVPHLEVRSHLSAQEHQDFI